MRPAWVDDMLGFSAFFLVVLAGMCLLLVPILWGANALEAKSCYERAEAYGLAVDYGAFKGCVVVTENGTVTSLDSYLTIRDGR